MCTNKVQLIRGGGWGKPPHNKQEYYLYWYLIASTRRFKGSYAHKVGLHRLTQTKSFYTRSRLSIRIKLA